VKPPSSQHDTQPFKSRPFIAPTAPPRPHLRHTPRPDSELLEPPAEGSAWTWNPEIVNADGANAAPNAVRNVCQEENSEHSILRGHCSVHQQRLIQQNKYQIFPGVDRAEAMQMAEQLSAWMESVKCHSTSAATAHHGKVMLQHHLHSLPEHKGEIASKYFAEHQVPYKWTLIEMNEGTPAGGGVPCQSNPIERRNLGQKQEDGHKRHGLHKFLYRQAIALQQLSAEDLEFGARMPRGYRTEHGAIDKEVWTANFFNQVRSELEHSVGVHKLMFKTKKFGDYADGTLIICSRKMREWLFSFDDLRASCESHHSHDARVKCFRKALQNDTVDVDGQKDDSYLKQYRDLILDPSAFCQHRALTFVDFMEWQKCFHILQPITDAVYTRDLKSRLTASGLPLNDTECEKLCPDPETGVPTKYFYKCTCAIYKHYLWCLHVALKAISDDLVKAPYCPPTLDSTKISHLKSRSAPRPAGRPARSTPGDALGARPKRPKKK